MFNPILNMGGVGGGVSESDFSIVCSHDLLMSDGAYFYLRTLMLLGMRKSFPTNKGN